MADLSNFLDEAKELLPAAVALRRRIHAHPELGLDLPLTTEAVLDGLKGLDVEIARGPSTGRRGAARDRVSQYAGGFELSSRKDGEPGPEATGVIGGPGSVVATSLVRHRCVMAAVNSPLLFSAPRVYPCQLG